MGLMQWFRLDGISDGPTPAIERKATERKDKSQNQENIS